MPHVPMKIKYCPPPCQTQTASNFTDKKGSSLGRQIQTAFVWRQLSQKYGNIRTNAGSCNSLFLLWQRYAVSRGQPLKRYSLPQRVTGREEQRNGGRQRQREPNLKTCCPLTPSQPSMATSHSPPSEETSVFKATLIVVWTGVMLLGLLREGFTQHIATGRAAYHYTLLRRLTTIPT